MQTIGILMCIECNIMWCIMRVRQHVFTQPQADENYDQKSTHEMTVLNEFQTRANSCWICDRLNILSIEE
jgi:hypothetical protein